MKKINTLLMCSALLFGMSSAYAADNMAKDNMAKDNMGKMPWRKTRWAKTRWVNNNRAARRRGQRGYLPVGQVTPFYPLILPPQDRQQGPSKHRETALLRPEL